MWFRVVDVHVRMPQDMFFFAPSFIFQILLFPHLPPRAIREAPLVCFGRISFSNFLLSIFFSKKKTLSRDGRCWLHCQAAVGRWSDRTGQWPRRTFESGCPPRHNRQHPTDFSKKEEPNSILEATTTAGRQSQPKTFYRGARRNFSKVHFPCTKSVPSKMRLLFESKKETGSRHVVVCWDQPRDSANLKLDRHSPPRLWYFFLGVAAHSRQVVVWMIQRF